MTSLLRSIDHPERILASSSPGPTTALPTSPYPTTGAPTLPPTMFSTTFAPSTVVVTTSVANGWSILLPILGLSFLAWIARKKDPDIFSKLGWGTHPVQEVWVDKSKSMHAHNDTVSTLDMQELQVIVSNPETRAIRKNTWNSFPDDPVDEVSLKSSDFHGNDDFDDDDDEGLGHASGLTTNYVRFYM